MIRKTLLIACCVLLVATAASAVVSQWGYHAVDWTGARVRWWVMSWFGSIEVFAMRITNPEIPALDWTVWWGQPGPDEWKRWFWFDFGADTEHVSFVVPIWVPLVALTASTWLLALPLLRTRRRRRRGQCISCGYDLTGNTSGRCPECGARVDT